MRSTVPAEQPSSLARDWINTARYYLFNVRGVLILSGAAVIGGIAFNWSWLVATGLAPILLAALPCAVMCGLGLCMNRLFGNSCEAQQARPADKTARPVEALGDRKEAPSLPNEALEETVEQRRDTHA
jgi:hypothetical protein